MTYPDRYHLTPEQSRFLAKKKWDENVYCGMKMENRAVTFTQPVAVLTDWNCASAGDDFAVFAKGAPNVTLIGTNTAGGTGQLLLKELPGGFRFAVSTYNCVMEDGTPICNNGVQPDIWCEQTVSSALAGQDAVLLRAIEHLEEKAGER